MIRSSYFDFCWLTRYHVFAPGSGGGENGGDLRFLFFFHFRWMLNFCEQIRRQPFFKPTMGPLLSNCFMETFKVKRRINLSVEKKQDRFLGFVLAALRSLITLLEPVCNKKQQKQVPYQLLVCGKRGLWRFWMV